MSAKSANVNGEMLNHKDFLPEYCTRRTVILGCGNILLGDDGFGPEVIKCLQTRYPPPADVALVDAGTGVVDLLFNITLSEVKPERIILVDAMGRNLPPGTVSVLPLESVQGQEIRTYSQHQIPTSSLLKDLHEISGIEISLLTVEPENIPQEIQTGLSPIVGHAVLQACDFIVAKYYTDNQHPASQGISNQAVID